MLLLRCSAAFLLLGATPSKGGYQEATVSVDQNQGRIRLESDNEVKTGLNGTDSTMLLEEQQEEEEVVVSEASYEPASPAALAVDEAGSDMGLKQTIDTTRAAEVKDRIRQAREYLTTVVQVDPSYESVRSICQNQHELCAFWAVIGECENNPAYMHISCSPVCQTCDLLDIQKRCPMDPDAKDALYPGDLNRLFERITTDPQYQQYEPRIISRPTLAPGDDASNVDYKVGGLWMVVFDKFLQEDEALKLQELGAAMGYERSKDVGVQKADGTFTAEANSGRTSTNSWCVDSCYEDPTAQRVIQRIANVTGIPEANSENLQLLRYETTQFYQTHNDYIEYQKERQSGVRILTFYMYLNDVEEGGGTNFPRINQTVTPKLGRAVIWPSVHDSRPNDKDARSDHQALPVVRGIKYGANAWIHQRDFKGPNSRGC